MASQVKFISLTQTEYDNLGTKTSGNLYFTTDTKRVYKGNDFWSSELVPVYDGNGEEYSDWLVTRNGVNVTSQVEGQPLWDSDEERWAIFITQADGGGSQYVASDYGGSNEDSLTLSLSYVDSGLVVRYYGASRTKNNFLGFKLAEQTNKVLVDSERGLKADTAIQPALELWYDDPTQYTTPSENNASIVFRPREVGMLDGSKVTELHVHISPTGTVTECWVSMILQNSSVQCQSDVQHIYEADQWVVFKFSEPVALSKDEQYYFSFQTNGNNPNDPSTPIVPIQLRTGTDSPDLYYGTVSNRPHIRVKWMIDMEAIKRNLNELDEKIQVLENVDSLEKLGEDYSLEDVGGKFNQLLDALQGNANYYQNLQF